MLEYFIKKLPKGVESSPDIKSRAEGYIKIMHSGFDYYVPVTKELKKICRIQKRKGQLKFENYKIGRYLRKCLRDIISGVYLQIRDEVGVELHQQLSQEIREGFGKLFSNYLEKRLETGLNQKLLINKKEKK